MHIEIDLEAMEETMTKLELTDTEMIDIIVHTDEQKTGEIDF